MLDRRKSDEVRSRQSLDGAGADGRREEGEVRWDIQTGWLLLAKPEGLCWR